MATFIAPLPSAFNHEAKDLASEFRYWRQCFNDFCEINKITDAQTLSYFAVVLEGILSPILRTYLITVS